MEFAVDGALAMASVENGALFGGSRNWRDEFVRQVLSCELRHSAPCKTLHARARRCKRLVTWLFLDSYHQR